jgi:2-polyprenyl-6-methoxyphenol hydroxylase-like FAD-dependent oxidoreductase
MTHDPPSGNDVRCIDFVRVVSAYIDGELDEPERARIQRHLESCAGCQAALNQFEAGDVQMPNDLGLHNQTLSYSEPGRTISLSSGRDSRVVDVSFVFAAEELAYDRRDLEAQKALVAERFAGIGWLGPTALAALREARSLYFDSLSQIHMDHFVRGRIALVGDAAYGATLGGLGTGLAMVGAYVLAGELAAAGGDHRVAFATTNARSRRTLAAVRS